MALVFFILMLISNIFDPQIGSKFSKIVLYIVFKFTVRLGLLDKINVILNISKLPAPKRDFF